MDSIRQDIRTFIISNFMFGQGGDALTDDQSFLETGVIDSTGVLELISFLEQQFGITVEDQEVVPVEPRLGRPARRASSSGKSGAGSASCGLRSSSSRARAAFPTRSPRLRRSVAGRTAELNRQADAARGGASGGSASSAGDRVAVHLDNSAAAVVAIFGDAEGRRCLRPRQSHDEGRRSSAYILRDCRAAGLVADARRHRVLTEALAACVRDWTPSCSPERGPSLTAFSGRRTVAWFDALSTSSPAGPRVAGRCRRRSRRAHLHVGLHRRAQGRDADAPQHGAARPRRSRRISSTPRTTSS